jgi:hypothetical protein
VDWAAGTEVGGFATERGREAPGATGGPQSFHPVRYSTPAAAVITRRVSSPRLWNHTTLGNPSGAPRSISICHGQAVLAALKNERAHRTVCPLGNAT